MIYEVPGECPLLLSEETMKRLDVVLYLRDEKIHIGEVGVQKEKLEFHKRSEHPIAKLLPTRRATKDEQNFVGEASSQGGKERTWSIEEDYDAPWEPEDTHYVHMKKGVRRRLKGLLGAIGEAREKPAKPKKMF